MQLLTYTYNLQEHYSTTKTPFLSVFSWYPPGPNLMDNSKALSTDTDSDKYHIILRRGITEHLDTMQSNFIGKMVQQQTRYNNYFDKKVRSLPIFTVEEIEYFNQPWIRPLAAERKAPAKYNKGVLCTTGPFQALLVRYHFLKINENGTENTISMDRGTLVGSQNRLRLPKSKKHRRHTTALHEKRQGEFIIHKIIC